MLPHLAADSFFHNPARAFGTFALQAQTLVLCQEHVDKFILFFVVVFVIADM